MKQIDSISPIQISLLLMTGLGLKNHVTVIPHLLYAAKRDAWISVLLALGFILLWGSLLVYIHKSTKNENIFDWIEKNIGKYPKQILAVIISLYFVFLAATSMKEMISWTKVSYLPITPSYFQVILFAFLCFCLANTSLQTIVIVNTFVLSAVILFGFFVGISNFQYKDFTLLTPILENGLKPAFSGMIYPLSGLIELIILVFIQHKIHGKLSYKLFSINSLILSWLILGPLIGSLTEFGPLEASRQKYPAFEQWGLVSLGRFFEHVDFLSIYQWITGAFIRVSFFLFLALEFFKFKTKRRRTVLLLIYTCLIGIANLFSISDVLLYYFIRKYVMPSTFWFFLATSILLTFFVFFNNRVKRRKSGVQKKGETTTSSSE